MPMVEVSYTFACKHAVVVPLQNASITCGAVEWARWCVGLACCTEFPTCKKQDTLYRDHTFSAWRGFGDLHVLTWQHTDVVYSLPLETFCVIFNLEVEFQAIGHLWNNCMYMHLISTSLQVWNLPKVGNFYKCSKIRVGRRRVNTHIVFFCLKPPPKQFLFTVRQPTLIFGPNPKLFMVPTFIKLENCYNTLFLPSNEVLDVKGIIILTKTN